MESNFNNRDFERFVKQNADQYRMFPSEKIWGGIHAALHTRRRRWYGFGLALLLITASLVTWVMLLPGNKEQPQAYLPATTSTIKASVEDAVRNPDAVVKGPVSPTGNSRSFINSPDGLQEEFFSVTEPGQPVNNNDSGDPDPAGNPVTNAVIAQTANANPHSDVTGDLKKQALLINSANEQAPATVTASPVMPATPATEAARILSDKPNIANNKEPARADIADEVKLPMISDRIAKISCKSSGKKSLGWQLYITPTVSYRTLSENLDFLTSSLYNNAVNAVGGNTYYGADVNTMVNHRPDLGFQLGARAAYPLSKWFSITGGLQLSVSKYDIKAYQHPAEVATIALMDRSVSTVSNFRNTNGYKENWLRNFYFSASIPVGLELKLSDGTRNYFGIAGTIQPTYVLDNRAYLISADYKNYAEMPSLTRRWNMNTSFEIFSSHTTGKLKWRVGPQVRYQVMSSFVKNYPINEHLFDFGLKLGIQLK